MYISSEREKNEEIIKEIIVPYSNIEITHVNDNRPPLKVVVKKAVVWILVVAMLSGLLLF